MAKSYLKAASIRVKCYKTLFKNCSTDQEKVDCLLDLLKKNGLEGEPTLEKCAKLKKKTEIQKDASSLDTSAIISESMDTIFLSLQILIEELVYNQHFYIFQLE